MCNCTYQRLILCNCTYQRLIVCSCTYRRLVVLCATVHIKDLLCATVHIEDLLYCVQLYISKTCCVQLHIWKTCCVRLYIWKMIFVMCIWYLWCAPVLKMIFVMCNRIYEKWRNCLLFYEDLEIWCWLLIFEDYTATRKLSLGDCKVQIRRRDNIDNAKWGVVLPSKLKQSIEGTTWSIKTHIRNRFKTCLKKV